MSWEDVLKVKYRTDERIDFPYDERLNPYGTGVSKDHEHNFSFKETDAAKKEAKELLQKITGESYDEVMNFQTEEEYDKTKTAKIIAPYWNWRMFSASEDFWTEHLVEWLKAGYPKDWIEYREYREKHKPADYGLGHHGYPKPKKGDEQ